MSKLYPTPSHNIMRHEKLSRDIILLHKDKIEPTDSSVYITVSIFKLEKLIEDYAAESYKQGFIAGSVEQINKG